MKWKILDTGMAPAEKNMAIDYALLRELPHAKQPILHFYEWDGRSATYGHFLDPYKFLNRQAVEQYGLDLARRPTGGGIVFHLSDFAFSMLVPATHPNYSVNTLENYAFVNRIVANVIQKFLGSRDAPVLLGQDAESAHPDAKHFCMAKPTRHDVMWQGKKVGGGAVRRTKHGFLHQGTICLTLPQESLIEAFLKEQNIKQLMWQNSCKLLPDVENIAEQGDLALRLKKLLIAEVSCCPPHIS